MRQVFAKFVLSLIRPALLLRLTATKRDEDFVDDAMRAAAKGPRLARRTEKS